MTEPVIAARTPAVLELDAGEYWWCQCGRSHNQPFCDGSHRGLGLAPVQLELEMAKRVALCRCKQTSTQPYCDGTHRRLSGNGS